MLIEFARDIAKQNSSLQQNFAGKMKDLPALSKIGSLEWLGKIENILNICASQSWLCRCV